MSLAPGRVLTHYRLVQRIGEGGMGVVWRATDTTLGRDVAIKVLPEAFAHDPERMARFEREARVLASLNHPRVASIFGVGSAEGLRFLAMELVEGEDLGQRLARGALPVAEAVEIAHQIAEALEAAHERGIIHRDLKPANVKVTGDGQVKVLDFGLAKALEGESATLSGSDLTQSPTITGPMTGANVILGTAAYMSPEQARGRSVDRRADIWAFGCVLYECLAGRRAFEGETVSDTLAKILERDPNWAALPAGTPSRVRELLERCLAKDARLRLRDIGDARIVLGEVLASRTSSGRLLVGEPRAARAPSRVPALAAAGALGLAAGAALWAAFGPRGGGAGSGAPTCVSIDMPPGVKVQDVELTRDARTVFVQGTPEDAGGAPAPPRVYVRRLDGYEFKEVPGTEGTLQMGPDRAGRWLYFITPAAPGASQKRLNRIPIDASAPPTRMTDWSDAWGSTLELAGGDVLVRQGLASFVRMNPNGATGAPVPIDAGVPGVSRYELNGGPLPGDRGALIDVIVYDARGWHFSVGVMGAKTGKVRIIEADGGSAKLTPDGILVFARGDQILAAPFDAGKLEPRGVPVAVWSGLFAPNSFTPARFDLTADGSLFYRPGQAGAGNQIAIVDASGKIESRSPERYNLPLVPEISPDGRHFAFSISNPRAIDEVWVIDYPQLAPRRIGSDPRADCDWPVWSPGGDRIAYARTAKDGHDGIYVQDSEGGAATRVFKSEAMEYLPSCWLPDGSGMILERQETGRTELALLPLGGGEADTSRLRPLLPSSFNVAAAKVSPDGRLIAYRSDESGKPRILVSEFQGQVATGRPVEVKDVEGILPFWSRDGRTLYIGDNRNRFMKVAVTTRPALSLGPAIEQFDFKRLGLVGCVPAGDGRFFGAVSSEAQADITRYDLVLGWSRMLAQRLRAARP